MRNTADRDLMQESFSGALSFCVRCGGNPAAPGVVPFFGTLWPHFQVTSSGGSSGAREGTAASAGAGRAPRGPRASVRLQTCGVQMRHGCTPPDPGPPRLFRPTEVLSRGGSRDGRRTMTVIKWLALGLLWAVSGAPDASKVSEVMETIAKTCLT